MSDHTAAPSEASGGPSEPSGGWREHSKPDIELRRKKARKIIALIQARRPLIGVRVLEIGTGAGVISAELAHAAGPDGDVVSIDTMDTRLDTDGYRFALTTGVRLPFENATFDVVVSNHVVEHVVPERTSVCTCKRSPACCGPVDSATSRPRAGGRSSSRTSRFRS